MKTVYAALVLSLALLFLFFSAQQASCDSSSMLYLRLPQDTAPERSMLALASAAETYYQPHCKNGVFDYAVDLTGHALGGTHPVRLLLYCPGYQVYAGEVIPGDTTPQHPFIPPLKPLASTTLHVKLVDSKQRPVPNRPLTVNYHMIGAMRYFGIGDGIAPLLKIGNATTDAQGNATFQLPMFALDPFFQSGSRTEGNFEIIGPSPREEADYLMTDTSGMIDSRQPDAHPLLTEAHFPPQSQYPTPLVVTYVRYGKLSGRIGAGFFTRHQIAKDVLASYAALEQPGQIHIALRAEYDVTAPYSRGHGGCDCGLRPDGTFEASLRPGRYQLNLLLFAPGTVVSRCIPVQSPVVVTEGENKEYNIP